ncbi:MAG: HEAT repeat domain-containing protein [Planctomycetota bacterium]
MKYAPLAAVAALLVPLASLLPDDASAAKATAQAAADPLPANHRDRVMTSKFCSECHPAIYAEHAQNTHGRAFTDEEVRLATGRFDHGDCIRCHTPRPVFETGIGMNPVRRWHNLEEGNTCMTCHLKADHDYSQFRGGAECKVAFDDRVGTVEACASCHRNHGTPYQWEIAPTGKAAKRRCITCHMSKVKRPVAVGEEPRMVRSHVFPGCRSEKQLRRAYRYEAVIEGNEAVVRITNKGTGHNLPTELKQRALESLVVVKDDQGHEVARSRMVFRDPYKRPYGLRLPVNTQIPAGQSREHRVPLQVADGTVECELHFKLYYPIEDHHPDLARQLESEHLVFDGVTPSDKQVETAPEVTVTTPEHIGPEAASPANLVDYLRPAIGTVEIKLPEGEDAETIAHLIEMFQYPVPEGNRMAQARLVEIGAPALPQLIAGLGSWDNKTWKQSQSVLRRMGEVVLPAVLAAFDHEELYVRVHARQLAAKLAWGERREQAQNALLGGLKLEHSLDRQSAAEALRLLNAKQAIEVLRPLLDDTEPDVVREAALALAQFDDRTSIPAMTAALQRAYFPETKRDLAEALGVLGSPAGLPELLDQLDHPDDLLREDAFESFFAVTGVYLGYDPFLPRDERLAATARLRAWWVAKGNADDLRRPPRPDARTHARAWQLVQQLGGGAGTVPGGDDEAIVEELVAMNDAAVPALVLGLKFPPGFWSKRIRICECLGRIGSTEAAPALIQVLREPVLAVAAWGCWALETAGDDAAIPALQRYHDRLRTLRAQGRIPATLEPVDRLLMQAARTRLVLGDERAQSELAGLLLSTDDHTRRQAIDALERTMGDRRGYDPDATIQERRAAAANW